MATTKISKAGPDLAGQMKMFAASDLEEQPKKGPVRATSVDISRSLDHAAKEGRRLLCRIEGKGGEFVILGLDEFDRVVASKFNVIRSKKLGISARIESDPDTKIAVDAQKIKWVKRRWSK